MAKSRKLVPGDPNLTPQEKEALEAAKEYERSLKILDMFKIENSKVFKDYTELLEELEQKRQVADKLLRGLDVSYGPWERFSEQKVPNAQALYNLVGEQKFLELGGTISQQPIYDIDKEKLEVAIAAKKIPAEAANEVLKVTPKYRAPKPQS